MEEMILLEETLDSFFIDSSRVFSEIDYRTDQLALESLTNPSITLEAVMSGRFNTIIKWFETAKHTVSDLYNKLLDTVKGIIQKKH